MINLSEYFDGVVVALDAKDGDALAQHVSVWKKQSQSQSQSQSEVDLSSYPVAKLAQLSAARLARFGSFGEVLTNLLKARKHLLQQDFLEAYNCEISAVIKFMELFREETNWVMPFLHVLILDTRMIACAADRDASQKSGDEVHDNLRSAEQHLKKGFAMAANDRAPAELSKKWGSLFIVNQLFKIYFKLNTIQLCRNLIRAVEGPAFPEFERFQKSDKVTYQYYVGRISMFEDQYHKAEKCLDYAWQHCHQKYVRNKRMILQFLVPVKLLLGVMPSPQLIEEYSLEEYVGLTQAIRLGDLRSFNEYLEKYQDQFIQQGVYLLIEKLRLVVLRNLFKKVYLVRQSHQLRLGDFQAALNFVTGETMDMDEIECILSNLIFKGYVKGYMSHQKKILVVSKSMPFPAITDVSN